MRTEKRFTPKVLERFLREGRGTGSYAEYTPWHRVSRGDPSSKGRSHLIVWRARQRELLSDQEWGGLNFAALVPNLVDLAEQFPLNQESAPHDLSRWHVGEGLSISTAHGFKGNQSDVVIVLDATERNYPLIHPNWIFSRVLGESESAIVDEFRRLFYVALTRAKTELFLLTEGNRRSPFLDEISSQTSLADINWDGFPPVLQDNEWLVVKVLGAYEAIKPLIAGLKADGYRYRDMSRSGGERTWDRAFRMADLDRDFLITSPWMTQAIDTGTTGVKVKFFDGLDRLRAEGEITDGDIILTFADGTSAPLDIKQLRSSVAGRRAQSAID